MSKKTLRVDNLLWLALFGVALVGVIAAVADIALAQESGAESAPTPWENVVVTFGGITLAWASAQMGLLQILKAIRIGDKPLLSNAATIWLANAVLGIIGMVIAATQAGVPVLAALIQAVIAVFTASGEYEFLAKTEAGGGRPTGSAS